MLAAHTTQFWRSRPLQGRRPAAFFAALVVYIIVILVAAPQAQQPQVFNPTGTASATVVRDAISGSEIDLMVGRSTVLNVGANIARVSLTVPDIADALVTAPSQLLIHGKKPGTISLFVWDKAGAISTFEVKVRHDLSALLAHLRQLFPGEDITVLGSGKDIVISGTVSSKYVIEKAGDMAAGYVAKKEDVVNMLKQQEGVASNQVMLRVRFAEVSRSAMQELGVNFFANGSGSSDQWYGRTNPGTPGPTFERRQARLQRLPEPVRLQREGEPRRGREGAVEQGSVPEPGRAEPDCDQRQGSQLPRRRRVSLSGRAVGIGHQLGDHHLQGVRRPSELYADGARRRPDSPQGQARGQLARLCQRGRDRRLPRAGAVDAPHRDRGRAARRADVRHRRADEQHLDQLDEQDSRASATSRSSGFSSRARRTRRIRPSSS